MEIRLAGIVKESIVDGPGIRYTVFVQGCLHSCPGCHNPQTHALDGGYLTDTDQLYDEICSDPLLKGVTFSGGEPFLQAVPLTHLGRRLREKGYDIIAFTGYTFEELLQLGDEKNHFMDLLLTLDYLIDGPFLLEERDLTLRFRGSRNQRILDCKKSLEQNRAVEADL